MVRIAKDLDEPIQDEDVLLIEDIIGHGLSTTRFPVADAWRAAGKITGRVYAARPARFRRIVQAPVDFRCFEIPTVLWWDADWIISSCIGISDISRFMTPDKDLGPGRSKPVRIRQAFPS